MLALAVALLLAGTNPPEVVAERRAPVLIVVSYDTGAQPADPQAKRAATEGSEAGGPPLPGRVRSDPEHVERTLGEVIEAHTDLSPRILRGEQAASIRACSDAEKLQCWTRTARTLSTSKDTYLLLVTYSAARAASLMLDVDRAADLAAQGGTTEELEDRIFSDAAASTSDVVHDLPAGSESFPSLAHKLLSRNLFRRHYKPNGSLRLSCDRPGLDVELDGVRIAESVAGDLVLENLAEGRYVLSLRGRDGTAYAPRNVFIAHDRSTEVRLDLLPREGASSGLSVFRGFVLASGLGATMAGAGLMYLQLGGGAPTGTPAGSEDPGTNLAPYGAALFSAGAMWTAGAIAEDEEPWLTFVGGVVLGGALYALGSAF